MTTTVSGEVEVFDRPRPTWLNAALGFAVLALGLGGAMLGHRLVPQVGVLTWSIGLGVAAANLGLLPRTGTRQLGQVTKRLLRVGVALLGFSVSFASISAPRWRDGSCARWASARRARSRYRPGSTPRTPRRDSRG